MNAKGASGQDQSSPSEASLYAIVLAAGKGKRMKSDLPKPLHEVAGRSMLLRVIDSLSLVDPTRVCVVVGHGAELVEAAVVESQYEVITTIQHDQLGTGHATQVAVASLMQNCSPDPDSVVIVLAGDTPLIRPETIERLVASHSRSGCAGVVLAVELEDPTGYGRVITKGDGSADSVHLQQVLRIVEQKDADEDEAAVKLVNASIYCIEFGLLAWALERLSSDNAAGELYLTDVVSILVAAGHTVMALVHEGDPCELEGVNDPNALVRANQAFELRRGS